LRQERVCPETIDGVDDLGRGVVHATRDERVSVTLETNANEFHVFSFR
jgi:hypothetical protein